MSHKSLSLLSILQSEGFHSPEILFPIVFVEVKGLLLSRTLDVRLILQQFLDTQQNLFHSDVWFPVFLLVQDRQAHSSRRVNVGVRNHWLEHALWRPESKKNYLTG